ncbi:PREDICTED: uncharacterized protein LOC107334244 isoform X1 [Acropora digitifera]|uniref:uncharacterized protein LOC107334244 isoform X1 n=1 Tax=Acropora digitifera TaxID=70779 RepID=UPI00077A224E|nr:PREDICTED: uncharacterized protein LOC107334244 isoform X1 [Acropora digitifera]
MLPRTWRQRSSLTKGMDTEDLAQLGTCLCPNVILSRTWRQKTSAVWKSRDYIAGSLPSSSLCWANLSRYLLVSPYKESAGKLLWMSSRIRRPLQLGKNVSSLTRPSRLSLSHALPLGIDFVFSSSQTNSREVDLLDTGRSTSESELVELLAIFN